MPTLQQTETSNYLIPAGGGTHAVTYNDNLSATPYIIDWRQYSVDNFPFQPQGVFVDNTKGNANVVITINPIGFNVVCAAGTEGQFQFPAPNGQSMSITGGGQATLVFVDFPVLPNAGQVTVGNTVNVNLASNAAGLSIGVVPSQNSGGQPYQFQEVPIASSAVYGNITGASVTASLSPPVNSNMRKLVLALSGNATLAVAGTDLLTVTLNGIVLYKQNVYIPAVLSANSPLSEKTLDFSKLGYNAGTAGTLVVSLATALATGFLDINAYFD